MFFEKKTSRRQLDPALNAISNVGPKEVDVIFYLRSIVGRVVFLGHGGQLRKMQPELGRHDVPFSLSSTSHEGKNKAGNELNNDEC